MVLPQGIAGFRGKGDEAIPLSDLGALLSACYEAARKLGGKVMASEKPYSRRTNNFAIVTMEARGESFAIVLNAHYPIVAFTEPFSPLQLKVRFTDNGPIREALELNGGFQILSKADLESKIAPEATSSLAAGEIDKIRYWRPRTIGEVIFNFWD